MTQSRLREQDQGVRLLLHHRGPVVSRKRRREHRVLHLPDGRQPGLPLLLVQAFAGCGQRTQEQGARLGLEPAPDHNGAVVVLEDVVDAVTDLELGALRLQVLEVARDEEFALARRVRAALRQQMPSEGRAVVGVVGFQVLEWLPGFLQRRRMGRPIRR